MLEKELIPVGATASRSVDVRILAATHTDLRKETREGRFRKDLYYRLDVFRLEFPPLRDRRTDILLQVEHFLTHWRRAGEDEGPALEDAEGVRSRAARLLGMGRAVRLLGMGRATLWRKMKEYGIEVE